MTPYMGIEHGRTLISTVHSRYLAVIFSIVLILATPRMGEVWDSVGEKLSRFIKHLSDGFYILYFF